MRFIKMHGAGNDYVYVDLFTERLSMEPERLAPLISDRHFGVGGDGLVLICPSDVADARMRMFNADGSEGEMCGNAIRCVAKYVAENLRKGAKSLRVATEAGIKTIELFYDGSKVERARVDMGAPILKPSEIPTSLRAGGEDAPVVDLPVVALKLDFDKELGADAESFARSPLTCVSMGNPHCVIFVDEITDELTLDCGPKIERSLENFPKKVNVEFAEIVSRGELKMRVWERGSGETLACGTGTCATVVAAILSGRTDNRVLARLRGGDLEIEWDRDGNSVFMTGPATEVFRGELDERALRWTTGD
ncbi:MAG: diaminopimelate epimerase [Thermoguttaceae bacterium]|nr:diaminopimelate epimerase [Thermoguttaceae bacterium]